MPMNRSKYPVDWPQISLMIRQERARWRCECTGECGTDHEAENATLPDLLEVVAELYPTLHVAHRCLAVHNAPHPITGSWVVLTVAHLCDGWCAEAAPGRRHCGTMLHLKAMCQRCHLRLDRHQHARNAAATRAQRRLKRQPELF